MKLKFTLYMFGQTDIGYSRNHNEDAISWDLEHGLALLADGMGGHNAGDVASRMCLESLNQRLLPTLSKSLRLKPNKGLSRHATLLRRAVMQANTAVFEAAEANPDYKGMGTTVVAVLFYADKVVVGHVGDSRVYRQRGQVLEQVTSDHSLVQELLDKGAISADDAEDNPYSHVITRAIGVQGKVVPELQEMNVQPGDIFLLCSDGLTDLVEDKLIQETLTTASGNWERAAQRLIDLANQRGGVDNISVVLAAVGGPA